MVSDFESDGVLILENFASAGACGHLRERALELVDTFDPATVQSVFSTTDQTQINDRYFIDSGDRVRFFLEKEALDEHGCLRQPIENSLNKMGHAMHDLDPVFEAFSRTPALGKIAQQLGHTNPLILQSMYIFKPPGIGGEVVCHQDSSYLYTEPESCLGFWFAIEDATLENGCMQFIPGGHKGSLRKRNYRTAPDTLVTETLDDTPFDEHLIQPAEAKKGSLVVFSGRAPHLSAANRSAKSRHAYTLHVIDGACDYPADNWLQRGPDLPLRGFS